MYENVIESLTPEAIARIPDLVDAFDKGSFITAQENVHACLTANGLANTNSELANENGIAVALTQEGHVVLSSYMKSQAAVNQDSGNVTTMEEFVIEDIPVDVPTLRRSGVSAQYPFDSLAVGQSFFVPATSERPEPWKSMASTVGSATRRYAEEYNDESGNKAMRAITKGKNAGKLVPATRNTRVFAITKDEKNGVPGARIGRTA